jgi:hypothetical protein
LARQPHFQEARGGKTVVNRIRTLGTLLAVVLLVAGVVGQAQGAILPGWIGNTLPATTTGVGVDGHIHFMVFDRTGGSGNDPWNTTITNLTSTFTWLDATADYLYLFQVVNDGTNTQLIKSAAAPALDLTSQGSLSGLGFKYDGSAVGVGVYLGNSATAGNPSAAVTGDASKGDVDTVSGLITPSGVFFTGSGISASFGTNQLAIGKASSLFGYTSNLGPDWGFGSLTSTVAANGELPSAMVAIPEPASLAIWALIAAGGAVAVSRKRRGRWTKANRQAILDIIQQK